MFFFYHMDMDRESGPFQDLFGREPKVEDLVNILKCYALADKYDARPFLSLLPKEFEEASSSIFGVLKGVEAHNLIQSHYSFCATTQSEMSIALLTFLFDHCNEFPNEIYCYNLAARFPNFGADMFILGMQTGRIIRQYP